MNPTQKLQPIIADLKSKAAQLDAINQKKSSHKYFSERRLFSADLFSSFSDKYVTYAIEIEKKLTSLEVILKHNNKALAVDILTTIEQQISALSNALHANEEIHHEAQIKLDAKKQYFAKKTTKQMMKSSHELYQTLSEYHEFERRLNNMIQERMIQQQGGNTLNGEVLALHQRLGRCRKAISQVERQIEMIEKPNS